MRYLLILGILLLAACRAASPSVEPPPSALLPSPSEMSTSEPAPTPTASPEPPPPAVTPAVEFTSPPVTPTPENTPSPFSAGISDASAYAWRPLPVRFDKPVGIQNAGDGSGRLFIVEQPGRIRVLPPSGLLAETFLDLTERVGSQGFEQGLLGLAFHPNYAETGFFYVNYTDLQGNTVIARFQVSEADANRASPDSETVLLRVQQPYSNHNGGALAFGPDGYLYLGLGDGGSGGDPQNNAQSTETLLGKILRLDVDHGDPYSIPASNPFFVSGGRAEIWAMGLRNPWRFSFDRLTGDLYIGDVGQNQWEEIDYLSAEQILEGETGRAFNFGWRLYEGDHPFSGTAPQDLVLIPPVAEYSHQYGCSVTGGVVYRGAELPAWQGIYLYGDFCTGLVWGLWRNPQGGWENQLLFENAGSISTFGEDERGEIYLADHNGLIFQLAGK